MTEIEEYNFEQKIDDELLQEEYEEYELISDRFDIDGVSIF